MYVQVREVDEDWLVAEDEGDGASDSDDSQKEADYPEDESGSDWASDGEEGGDAGAWRSRTTNHQSRWSSDDELDLYGERQEVRTRHRALISRAAYALGVRGIESGGLPGQNRYKVVTKMDTSG